MEEHAKFVNSVVKGKDVFIGQHVRALIAYSIFEKVPPVTLFLVAGQEAWLYLSTIRVKEARIQRKADKRAHQRKEEGFERVLRAFRDR
jgi:hypothetical protein